MSENIIRLFLLLAFWISFSASAYALTEETITHDGRERIFLVHIPAQIKDKSNIPVVMALHGGGGSAVQFASHIQMEKTADQNGFMVVYPQGTGKKVKMNTWNAGTCCSYAMENNVDDVGYISQLIDILVDEYRADPKRIYSTGHSNGAMMSYRLACELSDKITAIAPNGGQDYPHDCTLKRAVPVLHIHGKEDRCANYYGSTECGGCFSDVMESLGMKPMPQKNGICHPVEDMVKQWARFDGCAGTARVTFQKGDVSCETYSNCKDGAEVTLCAIDNAGHTWAGSGSSVKACERRPNGKLCTAMREKVGSTNMDINANDFMWQFFSKYRIN